LRRKNRRSTPGYGNNEGIAKPIFHGGKRAIDVVQNPDGTVKRDASGKPIGIPAAVREYSDTLLIFMLKGRNPAVFGDRQKQEHSAPGGGGITLVVRSVLQPAEEIET
jgi:hypothetical protein